MKGAPCLIETILIKRLILEKDTLPLFIKSQMKTASTPIAMTSCIFRTMAVWITVMLTLINNRDK